MMRLALAAVAAVMASIATAGISAPRQIEDGDGYGYYVQESEPGRHSKSSGGQENFELRAGDCDWQRSRSRDCRTHRERVEVRSMTLDRPGTTVCYRFDLLIPSFYPEMSPKQTLGQWHNGNYDTFSNRYERGKFEMVVNFRHKLTSRTEIPFRKGSWNRLTYRFLWGRTGTVEAWLGSRKVVDLRNLTLLESNVEGIYFKYGIYRSGMNRYQGSTAPTQTVTYRNVSRFTGGRCKALR